MPWQLPPITLLKADYLAQILATRIGYALQLCLGHITPHSYKGGRLGTAYLRRSCWALPWQQSSSREQWLS
jgi:hypothetical protein